MRKFLLMVTAAAGLAGIGFTAPAHAERLVFVPGVQVPGRQVVEFGGGREREWRRHERWVEWHRHQEWLRWHRWHHYGY